MDAPGLLLAALLCAEVAAVGLAVRARVSRPVIALLAFALADELACLALHAALDGAPRPLAGWYRAAWHVSIALSLGWPAALAWATGSTKDERPEPKSEPLIPPTGSPLQSPVVARGTIRRSVRAVADVLGSCLHGPRSLSRGSAPLPAFAGRAMGSAKDGGARFVRQALAGAYLGTLAGLAIVYPPSRAGLRWTLLAWEFCCVALAWWGLWRRRTVPWGAAEVVLVVLVACESAVCLVGPFASDPFTRWWIARVFYLGAWGLACAVLGRGIRSASRG